MRRMWLCAAALFLAVGTTAAAGEPLTLECLAKMDCCELERLYRQLTPGTPPQGFATGRAILCGNTPLTGLRSMFVNLAWRGKHFDPCCSTLVNQWVGFRAIAANVYPGESWLDGGPSLIMDYRHSSRVWRTVRDELREVAPGLYLGVMYEDRCCGPRFRMFFALEACAAACR